MPTTHPLSGYVKAREAAEILGYRFPSAISRLVADGKLTPAFKDDGVRGAYYFRRRDIERLARQRETATAKAAS